ncbi:Mobile element protein [Candidatus Enterovibrio escicola]|uniref:Mobile element protein n=1 Tax=Candidatus Enterovibrio escicola TaxID=1927127 RepID=A0A2A5T057_9GAMM|nr:Mobile element protein [Candidatus Enterovibrio escacola]
MDVSTHEVIAAEVSLVSVGDNAVLSIFLNPSRRKIQQVSADGSYDTKACHHVLKNKEMSLFSS